jgi:solute carrier family 35 protein F5
VSAVGYGGYAVQTRVLCPHDESIYSMQTVLGYIGLFNMVALPPIAIFKQLFSTTTTTSDNNDYASSKTTTEITWVVFGFLIVKGLFDNVLSDYLWLRAVILTNATPVATAEHLLFAAANAWHQAKQDR